MNTFCVYYDLEEPDGQYQILSNYLCSFPGFTRVGERMWLINTNTTCANIRDEVYGLNMPAGFVLMICKVGEDWAAHGLRDQTSQWLRNDWKP